jgi:hypothetical protein
VRLFYKAVLLFLQHPVDRGKLILAMVGLFDYEDSKLTPM